MTYKNSRGLLPMKYFMGQEVKFDLNGIIKKGIVRTTDFGGSWDNEFHSYDVYVSKDDCLYKHIPEVNLSEVSAK